MTALYLYALGLGVAIAAAGFTSLRYPNGQLVRSMAAVALNWMLGLAFNFGTGITDGWWFNICIDIAAAVVILYRPAGRWQAALGVTYCIQIAMHCGYGLLAIKGATDPMAYYNWLTGIAWLQLLVVGGWCGGVWSGRGSVDRDRAGGDSSAAGAGAHGMEEP
jgi:hypothetical protein